MNFSYFQTLKEIIPSKYSMDDVLFSLFEAKKINTVN